MIHLKRLVAGVIAGGVMLVFAASLCSGLLLGVVIGVLAFGSQVDLSGVGLVNPVSLVLFGIQVCYVVGYALCEHIGHAE